MFQAIVQITEKGEFSRFDLTRDSHNFSKTSEQTYRVLFVERGRFRREIVRRYGKRRGDRERSPVDPGLGLLQVFKKILVTVSINILSFLAKIDAPAEWMVKLLIKLCCP